MFSNVTGQQLVSQLFKRCSLHSKTHLIKEKNVVYFPRIIQKLNCFFFKNKRLLLKKDSSFADVFQRFGVILPLLLLTCLSSCFYRLYQTICPVKEIQKNNEGRIYTQTPLEVHKHFSQGNNLEKDKCYKVHI